MPTIIEQQHSGEPTWLWRLGNATAIDSDSVRSVGIAWGFKDGASWCWMPRFTGNDSLYYNALLFVRLSLPAGLFASVRWSASSTSKALLQIGAGWKLNGRLAILVRIQSDAASAAGSTGPNLGQATGFEFGPH